MKERNRDEEIIYGIHSCEAAAQVRPESIIKVTLTEQLVSRFASLLKELSRTRRGYNIVTEEELTRMTSTVHHGGISMVLRRRERMPWKGWISESAPQTLAVALVGVENPHNVGAIARSACHFGAQALLLTDTSPGILSGSAHRVSRGSLEFLTLVIASLDELLSAKNHGFELVALSPKGTADLRTVKFSAKTILLLGSEESGLPKRLEQGVDKLVSIAGTGKVESLNVSVAASTALYEWSSQHR